jgi:hypothetical protein
MNLRRMEVTKVTKEADSGESKDPPRQTNCRAGHPPNCARMGYIMGTYLDTYDEQGQHVARIKRRKARTPLFVSPLSRVPFETLVARRGWQDSLGQWGKRAQRNRLYLAGGASHRKP